MSMYKFNFKDKIPQKISKWHLVKFVVYTGILIFLIALILNKLSNLT
jgi:hypothetical protein